MTHQATATHRVRVDIQRGLAMKVYLLLSAVPLCTPTTLIVSSSCVVVIVVSSQFRMPHPCIHIQHARLGMSSPPHPVLSSARQALHRACPQDSFVMSNTCHRSNLHFRVKHCSQASPHA